MRGYPHSHATFCDTTIEFVAALCLKYSTCRSVYSKLSQNKVGYII